MNKQEVQKRVTQFGEPLYLDAFEWDEINGIFISEESHLVINFTMLPLYTFQLDSYCTIITGNSCNIKTRDKCTIITEDNCIIEIGYNCLLKIGAYCDVKTYKENIFKRNNQCIIVRRDNFEIIQPPINQWIRLNKSKGFKAIKK